LLLVRTPPFCHDRGILGRCVADPRPNIVFILVDQWRADCLGAAGHPVVETPHLDRLFAEGTRFDRAYAAVPSCIAARASILTGLTPRHHGRVGYRERVPWDYEYTLPGLLSAAGYQTHCAGKMHVHPTRRRLGFDEVRLHDGYLHVVRDGASDYAGDDDYLVWLRERLGVGADTIDLGLGCNGYVSRAWTQDEMLHPSSWVVTQAIDFLRRRDPTCPFFLNLSFHRPHPPLDPPRSYLDLYRDKRLPPVSVGSWVDPAQPLPANFFDSPAPDSVDEVDRARRAYYAQLTHIDTQLNRLTMALTEHRVLPNTAFLFCSDHGELLYDHNLVGKRYPYEGSARVPLLLRPPPHWRAPLEGTSDAPVELRDILPTCCEIAGVDVPGSIDGESLLALARGERDGWRDYVHGEHASDGVQDVAASNHWITDGREKYVWFSQTGREQLFDLLEDPQELEDRTEQRPERVAAWRRKLIRELEGREEGYVEGGKLQVGRPPVSVLKEAGL
jgi:arylsulfatase A-like enzyme